MIFGLFTAMAAHAIAEARESQQQAADAQRRAQQDAQASMFDHMARQMRQGVIIDVEAREVPDMQALPAPTNTAQLTRDQVSTTERDTTE